MFTSKGGNEVKGKKVSFTSTFPGAGGAKCTFEAAKVKSSFTIGGPVQLLTSKQKFKTSKKVDQPGSAPKEGHAHGSLDGHLGRRNRLSSGCTDRHSRTQPRKFWRATRQMTGDRPVRATGRSLSFEKTNRGCIRTWHGAQKRQRAGRGGGRAPVRGGAA